MVAAKKGEVVVGVQTHLKNTVKPKKKKQTSQIMKPLNL